MRIGENIRALRHGRRRLVSSLCPHIVTMTLIEGIERAGNFSSRRRAITIFQNMPSLRHLQVFLILFSYAYRPADIFARRDILRTSWHLPVT